MRLRTRTFIGVVVIFGLMLFIAVRLALNTGEQAGQSGALLAASERDQREQRILAWIVERNPQATIRDFQNFPAVLLGESAVAGIDFRIVMAMIDKESQFNPKAVGSSGEIGLMQILPATAAAVIKGAGRLEIVFEPPIKNRPGPNLPTYSSLGTLGDPKLNVRIGVAYLKGQVERFGMNPVALRAYNRHPDNARQHRPLDRYAEDIGLRLVSIVAVFPR